MLKQFYPYEYAESVFAIDYEKLWQMGYRGLLFDIDNTLVHHGDDSTPEIDALFREIQAIGFKTLLLSNNEEKRINRFMQNITSYYIHMLKSQSHGAISKQRRSWSLTKISALLSATRFSPTFLVQIAWAWRASLCVSFVCRG